MWYIEHFSLKGIHDQPVPRKHTLVDIFLNGTVAPDTTTNIQHFFNSADLLTATTLPDDLRIAELYGSNGISFSDLPDHTDKNIVLEISIQWLTRIPISKLKYITDNFHLMLTDFEDGGQFANSKLGEYMMLNKFIPKKTIFYATSSSNIVGNTDLNIQHLHIPYWLFHVGTKSHKFHANNKQQYLDQINCSVYTNNILFMNFKPRLYRMKMLLKLFEHGLLDRIDWSLIDGVPSTIKNTTDEHDRIIEIGNNSFLHTQNSPRLTSHEQDLLTQFNHAYTFPRIHSPITTMHSILSSPPEDFAKYSWLLSIETGYGNEFPLRYGMGNISFITEKTYRAFTQGSMPIILCDTNSYQYLTELGFQVDNLDLDCYTNSDEKLSQTVKRIEHILDNNIVPEPKKLAHNFNLITDINWLGKQFSECLINIHNTLQTCK